MQHASRFVAHAPHFALDIEQAAQIAADTSPNLTEKVPPKPQHSSQPFISLSSTPFILASSARGCALMPMLRSPLQES